MPCSWRVRGTRNRAPRDDRREAPTRTSVHKRSKVSFQRLEALERERARPSSRPKVYAPSGCRCCARITQIATPLRQIRTGHAARTNRDTALDRQEAALTHKTHSSFEFELERASASARFRPVSGQDYRRHQITLHAMATAGSHPDNACATDVRCVRARNPRKTRRDARFASPRAFTRRFGRFRAVSPPDSRGSAR